MSTSSSNHTFLFGFISVFLIGLGFSIVSPVIPFLVEPYVENSKEQALMVTLLTSTYAFCMFFASPILGALSDRFGRRPILLISLFGAATGFLIFGIGGSLWILFIGRIIEGITGGSISTVFAYFADITPKEQRTKYFGWIGAIASVGLIIGPTFGGIIASYFGYAAPMYFGAGITFLNVLYGFIFMPESIKVKNQIKLSQLNPFIQLLSVFSIYPVRKLLSSAFFLWIASGSLQAILSQFTIDVFTWGPTLIGLVFSIIGIQDILSQWLIMPRLLNYFSDRTISTIGMIAEMIGYIFIALSAITTFYPLFIIGMFIYGFGDSIFTPSFNGMLSKSGKDNEQGMIQGGSQSVQALSRIIGPMIGGYIYVSVGFSAPALLGAILLIAAIVVLHKKEQSHK